MINPTEMAKPFKGKMVEDFLRLKNTQEYIQLIEERYGNSHIAPREVLRVVKDGDAAEGLQGTWMDEKNVRRMIQFAEQFGDFEIVVTLSRQFS